MVELEKTWQLAMFVGFAVAMFGMGALLSFVYLFFIDHVTDQKERAAAGFVLFSCLWMIYLMASAGLFY